MWLRSRSWGFLLNGHLNKPVKRSLPAQIDLEGLWAGTQTLLFYWSVTPGQGENKAWVGVKGRADGGVQSPVDGRQGAGELHAVG